MDEKSGNAESKDDIEKIRHSTAHLLAHAVTNLWPDAKPATGPAVSDGFYYDFGKKSPFVPDDLKKIEDEMHKIAKNNSRFERIELSEEEAREMFSSNRFKLELIDDIVSEGGKITAYKEGDFTDLCRGPHIESAGKLKGVYKLMKISSAYWKGDQKNESLQRIYGIAFETREQLKDHLRMIEEAEKRDHRKIGKSMDLFSFHEEAAGMPFWHPKGTVIYNKLTEFVRKENTERGYSEVRTPSILNSSLWKVSGHWDNFKENMFFTSIEGQDFAVKPMNCPGGMLIYKSKAHSYRELPLRNAEFGYVHRNELSGVLSGLFRVRAFTQDDAHVFCAEEQIEAEIIDMVDYAEKVYKTFGFNDVKTFIATKPDKAIGSEEAWKTATSALKSALEKKGLEFSIKEGEGAFYGPKIEFNIKDAIGRNWQCGTIQVDFSMPARFEANYESKEGIKKTPVMIHRAILGSLERFIGILVEHYAGKFPLWISPVQARVLTIADRHNEYAESVIAKLKEAGIRAELDERALTMSKKVREAQISNINYILVVGDQEMESGTVNIRTRDNNVLGAKNTEEFISECVKEINSRA